MTGDERAFQDAVDHLHMEASTDGHVERAIAVMAQRFFGVWQSAIEVTWAAASDDLHHACLIGDELCLPAIGHKLGPVTWNGNREYSDFAAWIGETSAGGWIITFGSRPADTGDAAFPCFPTLTVHLVGERSEETAARIQFFESYMRGHQTIYRVARALKSGALVAKWERDVRALANNVDVPLLDRLRTATRLARELTRSVWSLDARRLLERLALWALHEQLGTGWGVQRLVGKESGEAREEFCNCIREGSRCLKSAINLAAEADSDLAGRLQCIADIIDGPPPIERLTNTPVGTSESEVIRRWSWLQELARREVRMGGVVDAGKADKSWDDAATSGMAALSQLGAAFWQTANGSPHKGLEVPFLRSWLHLWFALDVLTSATPQRVAALLPSERWVLRADLAYCVREALRFMMFGTDSEYRFQPAALSAALRTLVTFHAHRVLGVPSELDIGSHLEAIADAETAGGYHFAMGHLQHVLDVYVGGFFISQFETAIGSSQSEGSESRWTAGHLLASRPGLVPSEHSKNEFLCSFAISAIFHDVGMMLLSPRQRLPSYIFRGDAALEEQIQGLNDSPTGAGSTLAETCATELRAVECLPRGDPLLLSWLSRQMQVGVPEHSLVGAWYLYRLGLRGIGTSGEVLRAAVRSVLLHGAGDVSVDTNKDPAAALLVLSDELFEWTPFDRAPPDANSIGRSPSAMAVDVGPHVSRAARILFEDVTVGAIGNRLQARIGDACSGWPRITMLLRHPEFLDVPVHRCWLSVATNLGRMTTTHYGWAPTVVLRSRVADRSDPAWRTLARALRRTRLPIRPALERWLAEPERFPESDLGTGWDIVNVTAKVDLLGIMAKLPTLCDEIDRMERDAEDRRH